MQAFRLPGDDGDARLKVRGLHVGRQAPLKPGFQTVLQRGDVTGRPVRGEHYLLFGLVQRIKGMEELLLHGVFAGDKLDIIHQKQVRLTVFLPEGRGGAPGDGRDNLVGKVLAFGVDDRAVREVLLKFFCHGVEQVGLTQPGAAVDEQRVVQQRGLGRHRLAGGVGKPVGRPHHEGVEGQLVVVLFKGVRRGLLLFQLLVDADLEGDAPAEHVVEGLLEQIAVAAQQRLLVKLVGRLDNGRGPVKIQADGF